MNDCASDFPSSFFFLQKNRKEVYTLDGRSKLALITDSFPHLLGAVSQLLAMLSPRLEELRIPTK